MSEYYSRLDSRLPSRRYSSAIRAGMDAWNERQLGAVCPYPEGSQEAYYWYRARNTKGLNPDFDVQRIGEEIDRRKRDK